MPGTFFHGVHLKTIEDNDSKLEDILDSVHLGYYWYSDQKWTRERKRLLCLFCQVKVLTIQTQTW